LSKFLVLEAIYSLVLSSPFEGEYQNILSSHKLSAIIFFTKSGIFSHFATGSQMFSQEISFQKVSIFLAISTISLIS
jgi:hypothetical protein